MLIGIISDTHMNSCTPSFEGFMHQHFNSVDMVIHAGDYCSAEIQDFLIGYKEFAGVRGNADHEAVKDRLNEEEILKIEAFTMGVFHGHGDKGKTADRAFEKFKSHNVDIIIYGHSHQPSIMTRDRVLMLNPGSITRKRRERWASYILLELGEGTVNAELRFIQD